MQIQFKLKAKGSWSESQVSNIKLASRWAAARLGFTKMPITIVIRLVGPHPEQFGSCSMVDDTRYIIWLQSGLDITRTISTLFHEMTHIKQHLFDGLYLHSASDADFRHEQYTTDDYWNAPWEKEARKAEYRLLNEFLEIY
jgi:uncharacterized protein YjaZ